MDEQNVKLFDNTPRPFYKRLWFVLLVTIIGIIVVWIAVSAGIAFYRIKKGEFDLSSITTIEKQIQLRIAASGLNPKIYTSDDPHLGNPNATIWIVEFSDFGCPYCRESAPIMRQLLVKYPDDVFYIYRDFPIASSHPNARQAAEAAACAYDQGKFWEYHDKLFINQERQEVVDLLAYANELGIDMQQFNECLSSSKYLLEIEEDYQAGIEVGVTGTPNFFVNGEQIDGLVPFASWEELILAAKSEK